MDKKSQILYVICGILVILIIAITVAIVVNSGSKPVKISSTELTYKMAKNLLDGYCKVNEREARNYILKDNIKEAYLSLINKKTDVVLASDIDDETIKWLEDNGVEIEKTAIARDALVFLKNADNPIKDLTEEQIRGIFSGKYLNWAELGGDDAEIIAYSSDNEREEWYMMKMFMGDRVLIRPKYRLKDESFNGLKEALISFLDTGKKSIGYTTYYNVKNNSDDEIRMLSVSGVEPSESTIKSGEYLPTMNIYVIIRKDTAKNSQTRRFVEYIISKNGQAIIEQCGYVNLVK